MLFSGYLYMFSYKNKQNRPFLLYLPLVSSLPLPGKCIVSVDEARRLAQLCMAVFGGKDALLDITF